MDVKNLMLPMG